MERITAVWCLITVPLGLIQFDWSGVWYSASHLGRIFLFLLTLAGIYAVYFAAFALFRLRKLRAVLDTDAVRKALTSLENRSANLRQLVIAMFYLFGLVYLLGIRSAYWTPDNNRAVGLMVLENLKVYFLHGASLFLVFFVLHAIEWFVSSRIRAARLQLDK